MWSTSKINEIQIEENTGEMGKSTISVVKVSAHSSGLLMVM